MGLGIPVLTMLSLMGFVFVALIIVSVGVFILYNAAMTPVVESYADLYMNTTAGYSNITITVHYAKGIPTPFQFIVVPLPNGQAAWISQLNTQVSVGPYTVTVSAEGLGRNNTLLPGSTAKFHVDVDGVYSDGVVYQGFIVFEDATTIYSFTP